MILTDSSKLLHMPCKEAKYDQAVRIGRQLQAEWKDYQAKHPEFYVVGLAAPQIGRLHTVFVAFGELFINPRILWTSPKKNLSREGCCSLHGEYEIERPQEIRILWTDVNRHLRADIYSGSYACVIAHEMQHLNGELLSDNGTLIPNPDKKHAIISA